MYSIIYMRANITYVLPPANVNGLKIISTYYLDTSIDSFIAIAHQYIYFKKSH